MSASTHCWQCGKRLVPHPATRELIFVLVGDNLRVHKTCEKSAKRALGAAPPMSAFEGRTEPKPTYG